jgi:uncharacterized protein YeaO (DUF488 family)
MISLHRIYDARGVPEGRRFLVDRLWPRGIKRDPAVVWLKDVAPSNELRKWYSHDPGKWPEFQQRYFAELDSRPDAYAPLIEAARSGSVVLLYSSQEREINNAVALKRYIEEKLVRSDRRASV